MQNDSNTGNPVHNGILFIHAYNVQIRVSENQLLIDYRNPVKGEKTRKTSLRLNRATSGLKRLIISGDDGYISLSALRWLSEVKAAIMQIGFDNDLYLASVPPGSDYPALRRYQVMAGATAIGTKIVRDLLTAKIEGQIEVMSQLGGETGPLKAAIHALHGIEKPSEMMIFEAQASAGYWNTWKNISVNFATRDQKNLPDHWVIFNKRASDFGNRPRKATNPANAMLNYLYAILKGETTTALQAIGLDPGIGLLHADNPESPNLSLDVMEPVRPSVDTWFLSFLEKRVFSKREFYEMTDGSVRLGGDIRRELSVYGPIAFSQVAPWAEYFVHTLEKEFKGKATFGTPLTQNHRKKGRDPYRVNTPKRTIPPKVENHCIQCGKPALEDNLYCADCFPDRREEIIANFSEAGINQLKQLRKKGITPAHGGTAAEKRGITQSARIAARKEWEKANPGRLEEEKQRFLREIHPLLQDFTVTQLAKVCHCSLRYASKIKNNKQVPHPAFYEKLITAINQKEL